MSDFTIIGRSPLIDIDFLMLEELTVTGPGGTEFTRSVVRHCGAVAVVALEDPETAVCVRQYRAALDRELLEIVAGRTDKPGEATEAAAQRELAEEIGMRAGRLVKLCEFFSAPGFTDELLTVYLALDLAPTDGHERDGHEEDAMTIERVPLGRTSELIASGALTDAKSIIGLTLAQQYLAGSFPGMR